MKSRKMPTARSEFRTGAVFSSLLAFAVTTFVLFEYGSLARETVWMAGIFVLAAGLWVTEAFPPYVTSLIVISLEILLLSNPGGWRWLGFEDGRALSYREVIGGVADPVILLFFGGFLMARAATKTGIDQALASTIVRLLDGRPFWVLAGLAGVTAVFSMWMSNTATTAMMMTLVVPLFAYVPKGDPFRKALLLGVCFGANIGGMGTPIGTPPNAVALGYLRKLGLSVGFLEWMVVAVPLMIGLLILAVAVLWFRYKPRQGFVLKVPVYPFPKGGLYVTVVFGITVLLWLTDSLHGLPASVVALVPVLAFTVAGTLTREDLNQIEWNILILIGGGLALGYGMHATGLDQVFVSMLPITSAVPFAWIVAMLTAATVLLSTFMSNTAAANLMLPIGISVASTVMPGSAGALTQMAVSLALAGSVAMALPISTPPNAIAYANGDLSTKDMATVGALVGLLATGLIIAFGGAVIAFWHI